MERWSIVVSGTGAHHTGAAGDVDELLARFVEDLRKTGHQVHSAKLVARGLEEDHTAPRAAPAPPAPPAGDELEEELEDPLYAAPAPPSTKPSAPGHVEPGPQQG